MFRNKCKGRIASLVLIKVQYTDKIFGGYSSIGISSIEGTPTIYNNFYQTNNLIIMIDVAELMTEIEEI